MSKKYPVFGVPLAKVVQQSGESDGLKIVPRFVVQYFSKSELLVVGLVLTQLFSKSKSGLDAWCKWRVSLERKLAPKDFFESVALQLGYEKAR